MTGWVAMLQYTLDLCGESYAAAPEWWRRPVRRKSEASLELAHIEFNTVHA